MDETGPGSLKLITASSNRRSLRTELEAILLAHVRSDDIRHLYDEVFIVFTEAEAEAIRGWLKTTLRDGDSAFVTEFERWSALGSAADQHWLLRRGH